MIRSARLMKGDFTIKNLFAQECSNKNWDLMRDKGFVALKTTP